MEVKLTPKENFSWPQTLESGAALSPLRRRNCLGGKTNMRAGHTTEEQSLDIHLIISAHSP